MIPTKKRIRNLHLSAPSILTWFKRMNPMTMRKFQSELMFYFIGFTIILLISIVSILYSWMVRTTIQTASQSTVETIKQVDRNFHLIFGSIQDISLFIISNHDIRSNLKQPDPERINLLTTYENLSNLTNTETFITSINIYGDNGLKLETGGPSRDQNHKLITGYERQIPQNGFYIVTPTYQRFYQYYGERYVFSLYRQINDINNLTKRLGILRIDVDENAINHLYHNIRLGDTGYIFIANKDGLIISHSQKKKISQNLKNNRYFSPIFKGKEGYYREKINGREMLITYYASRTENLLYVGIVPFKELVKKSRFLGWMSFWVILFGTIIAILISYLIASKVTLPIKQLTALMKKVEKGNLDVVIDINRRDEIGSLAGSFNQMTHQLKYLIEEVYHNKIMRKEAELKALQNQINPHFLYNTLDTIYWTARQEQAPQTEKLVQALAKLFRLGLNRGNELTTIEKEIEHLESYLIIQKNRYDVEPQINLKIDPAIKPYVTIKLILQPLVENALYHGIDELDRPGQISISGWENPETIVFEIRDNGIGMTEQKIEEIFSKDTGEKKGYGIKNVDERIKLYFGEKYGLTILSAVGVGTTVRVTIPKAKFKEQGGGMEIV